jgi:hypothetical protein
MSMRNGYGVSTAPRFAVCSWVSRLRLPSLKFSDPSRASLAWTNLSTIAFKRPSQANMKGNRFCCIIVDPCQDFKCAQSRRQAG